MAIANIRHFGELPSRLHLLSSQTLALLSQDQHDSPSEFDFMNLNGLYRFLEDFKSSELVDRATTGVVGVEKDETFDETLAATDAGIASESIAKGLKIAYPETELVEGAQKLQQALVYLAGLTPKQAPDLLAAKSALIAINHEIATAHSQPMHA